MQAQGCITGSRKEGGTDLHVQLLPLQEDLPDLRQVVAAHSQDLPLLLAGQVQRLRQTQRSRMSPQCCQAFHVMDQAQEPVSYCCAGPRPEPFLVA